MYSHNKQALSLTDVINWYTNMLAAIPLIKNPAIQPNLEKILREGQFHAKELAQNPDILVGEIHQYLSKSLPFEWNRNQSGRMNRHRVEQDWKQHDELTLFAMLVGPKYGQTLLLEWGVNYPLGPNGPGLADPSKNYIQALESVAANCTVEAQRDNYTYLISQLKFHLNLP
ncbi:MAG: hypothetical protein AAGI69_03245 [Cyanobacteria bacterium P01_H01_bin.21]